MEIATEMRCGQIPAATGVEQVLDAVVVEEERVAASAGEERVRARSRDVGLGAERHLDVGRLLPVLRRAEHVAEREVGERIAVVVDVEPVDGVRVQRVGRRVGIEDEHGPRRVRG
jgi:hypothetical protein